jgi:ATP-dependent helicase/nuclease subunit A
MATVKEMAMSSGPAAGFRIPDGDVRDLVVERVDQSFIVQAPAGSGKTELLTQRFLALLATVEHPESVLAITFTRKAASEMRIRVLEALDLACEKLEEKGLEKLEQHKLRRRELAQAVLAQDKTHGWRLLENPMRLQIRTVDSLADSIARQLPMLAGISNDLEVTEDAEDLYREAAARTLEEVGSNGPKAEAVATLLRYRDNKVSDVRELLVSMLRKRDQWLRIVSGTNTATEEQLASLRVELEAALQRAVEDDLRKIRQGIIAALGGDACRMARLARAAAGQTSGDGEVPKATASELESWRSIAELLLTKAGTIRKKVGDGLIGGEDRSTCEEILDALGVHADAENVCALLKKIRKLPTPRYSEDEWQFVSALLVTLLQCAAHLKVVFAEKLSVDFIEMASAAKTALETDEGPTELGLALGSQLKHLLVDEFQDTSQTQLGLVNALTRTWEVESGNTLFLVGDPMQSIYMFREAEVTIFTRAFRETQEGVRDLRWKVQPVRLTANFRSQKGLVDWFNRTHSQILTGDDDALSAVGYSKAESVEEASLNPVMVKGFSSGDKRGEAVYVAEEIAACLKEDPRRTIAVLVRARAHLAHIVRELEARGIGYRAVEIDEFAKRQTVLDLDALARSILDEADRTAWLAVLRAPWVGLTLADLWELCRGDRDSTIASLLQTRLDRLSVDGRERASRFLNAMKAAARDWSTMPFRVVLERAWISLGGPAALRESDAASCAREASAYFEFLEERWAAGSRPGTRQFQAKLEKLYAPAATDPSIRVDLLTIHKSKGLEWDVVFLPGLGRGGKRDDKQLLYWREQVFNGNEELLLGPMRSVKVPEPERTIEHYLQGIARDREKEEHKRLLYVATTRAKKRFYLTGDLTTTDKAKVGSILSLLWPVADVAAEFLATQTAAPASVSASGVSTKFRRLPLGFVLPAAPEVLRVSRRAAADVESEPLHTFDWVGETQRRVGTVTHAFLQAIGREGIERWDRGRVTGARGAIRTALMTEGVGLDRIDTAVAKVESALLNSISSERGRWILTAREGASSELAITANVEGLPKRLKIDRTFIEGTVRWVVDFKTTEIQGGDSERYFVGQVEKYREDLAQYAEALRLLDPEREIKGALYFPLQNEFRVVSLEG